MDNVTSVRLTTTSARRRSLWSEWRLGGAMLTFRQWSGLRATARMISRPKRAIRILLMPATSGGRRNPTMRSEQYSRSITARSSLWSINYSKTLSSCWVARSHSRQRSRASWNAPQRSLPRCVIPRIPNYSKRMNYLSATVLQRSTLCLSTTMVTVCAPACTTTPWRRIWRM